MRNRRALRPRGATLSETGQPFLLTGEAGTELIAEYYADQLAFSVNAAREDGPSGRPEDFATGLVPDPPLHIRTSEGTAAFDGGAVHLMWSEDASSRKRKEQRREFGLAGIRQVDWVPSSEWSNGYLRVVPGSPTPTPRPNRAGTCAAC
ncbi:hypothetical protein HDA32_005272 [Spinactinospora alkalitolerans]|uniref:DUF4429 domain-containing protein n=1 Tax=Spinactinospora alkalitolerans TaxID=687207 RepID=A0A852U3T9_9ACTN|nr:DUF4429 domain-containing protein [Spinactinospora alkalitolerans]NYE50152.1 hypothetical protein [Spinactinospora alkalitolerans]